jgi:hypothetical protein
LRVTSLSRQIISLVAPAIVSVAGLALISIAGLPHVSFVVDPSVAREAITKVWSWYDDAIPQIMENLQSANTGTSFSQQQQQQIKDIADAAVKEGVANADK